jgi:hypothetical protein
MSNCHTFYNKKVFLFSNLLSIIAEKFYYVFLEKQKNMQVWFSHRECKAQMVR